MRTVAVPGPRRAAALTVSVTALLGSAIAGAGPAGAAGSPGAADRGKITVVADGLDNPRHLVVDGRGDLYVAEAGRGAADPAKAPCVTTPNPETGQPAKFCYGPTSAITRIHHGKASRVVTGLPSVAETTGQGAGGVSDLTVPADGRAVGVVNLGGDPRDKAKGLPAPAVGAAGHLVALDLRRDRFRVGTDVSAFEARRNADAGDPGSQFDSNPYAVEAARNGTFVVADAGGNDLLSVDRDGRVRLLAVFHARLVDAPPGLPNPPPGGKVPMQAVPNSVVRGPDGAWYVGELTGFPFVKGAARVWRVEPGHDPKVVATGFTNIIDVAFDRRGRLLVLEFASNGLTDPKSPGSLWRVDPRGHKTLVTDKLTAPGGVVVGADGAAYVTNLSVLPGKGQVLRVPLRG